MKEYQFKKYQLSSDEKLWLTEILKLNFAKYDSRQIKAMLWDKLSKGFDPTKIDRRLCNSDGLTLLGLWYINRENWLINLSEEALNFIKSEIKNNSKIDSINHNTLASKLNISPEEAQIVLKLLFDLHFFNSGAGAHINGLFQAGFGDDPKGFDKILSFENLDETLEEYFIENDPNKDKIKILTKLTKQAHHLSNESTDDIWSNIFNDFEITKPGLGKKINFVTDDFKRKIIFRDIEQSYLLAQNGFSKPAVIIAGSVIEELLRWYLISKNVKPKSDKFECYIEACEEHKLLTAGINRLSDSVRHFRNLVHLAREDNSKKTITKANAKSAVASLFSIIHDFQ
jgi:hypothetical protein